MSSTEWGPELVINSIFVFNFKNQQTIFVIVVLLLLFLKIQDKYKIKVKMISVGNNIRIIVLCSPNCITYLLVIQNII